MSCQQNSVMLGHRFCSLPTEFGNARVRVRVNSTSRWHWQLACPYSANLRNPIISVRHVYSLWLLVLFNSFLFIFILFFCFILYQYSKPLSFWSTFLLFYSVRCQRCVNTCLYVHRQDWNLCIKVVDTKYSI